MIMNCSSNYQFTTRLQVNNTQLEVISETHVLGTILRSDLSWYSNTRYLVKRGYARMTILRNLYKFNIPEEDLVQIYCMYIRSVLEYNSSVWFSSITQEENYDLDSDIELGNAHKKAYGLQDIMKNTLFKMRNFST